MNSILENLNGYNKNRAFETLGCFNDPYSV